MKYYYMETSKGRAGSGGFNWYSETAETKAEIKKKRRIGNTRVAAIYTEEEMRRRFDEAFIGNRVFDRD